MLEVFANFSCRLLIIVVGFYIIKILLDSRTRLFTFKNIFFLILLTLIPYLFLDTKYQALYTIIVFLLNTVIYKLVFQENITKMVVVTSMLMIFTFIVDLIYTMIAVNFISIENIRNSWYQQVLANIVVSSICMVIMYILIKIGAIKKVNQWLNKVKSKTTAIFLILITIVFAILAYIFYLNFRANGEYILNIVVLLIFMLLLYIYFKEKEKYVYLSTEYDSLFTYIQTFEAWIEKEQLNQHEYKNQLAVLRCLTKEAKVKNKIDEILEDNINIEGQEITSFKNLPKGGIKGLMYYKAAIAQKKKINLTTDVCLDKNSYLTKLSEKDIYTLCKLIGIYFDNAIEAAIESKKKNLMIEVYELKDKVDIIFSNSFKKHKQMKDRNKKGISSKGEGRGNGLYFASKLIDKNKWIEEKQEIIDNYYIQKITINKKEY